MYISCNYSCTLYVLVKTLFVELKNLHSYLSMLQSVLCYSKTKTKNMKVAKIVEFIKTCDQYPCRFNFGHFPGQLHNPPFLLEKIDFRNRCSGGIGNFLLPGGEVCLGHEYE